MPGRTRARGRVLPLLSPHLVLWVPMKDPQAVLGRVHFPNFLFESPFGEGREVRAVVGRCKLAMLEGAWLQVTGRMHGHHARSPTQPYPPKQAIDAARPETKNNLIFPFWKVFAGPCRVRQASGFESLRCVCV